VWSVRKKFKGMAGVKDAWFVGMVPGEVSVVWIGHDEGAPFPGSGSSSAGGVWFNYAKAALSGNIKGNFPEVIVNEERDIPVSELKEESEMMEVAPPEESEPQTEPEQEKVNEGETKVAEENPVL
jgi:membrane peptidoglycan carboxypeptidase